ncbi:cyclin-dependent kinase B1-1 isoform X2 [Neltuma alba]|uniref:cyclin-dependent kinase B1-1 isoform X2 n=1 Tax=Neltuma alba TaxID=207710 RepID=UPI0010A55935|nr:cyclin-dependent kinase B1-1-like isoform X2 [Prosopis alba]
MEKYDNLEKIGEGTYGKVYKATDKATGRLVALKKMHLEIGDQGIPPTTLREISLLKMLYMSIYVVHLLSVELTEKTSNSKPVLFLVFEHLDTDLKKYMDSRRCSPVSKSLSPSRIQSFLYQLCMGVFHCHRHGVLHRDLKPQNLLLDQRRGILKIADFGLGRALIFPPKSYTPGVVTLCYRALEILLGSTHYSFGVDMWSVGCIFGVLNIISLNHAADAVIFIPRICGTPTEEVRPGVTSLRDWHAYPQWKPRNLGLAAPSLEPDGVDLLSKMLKYNPAERTSAKEALDHPYFRSLDKSQF